MERRRYSVEQWLEWLLEQPKGGLSIARFCDEKGVSANSFYLWRRKLRKELKSALRKEKRDSRSSVFVPVEVVESRQDVAVELPCGATVKVPLEESSLRLVFQILLELGSPQ